MAGATQTVTAANAALARAKTDVSSLTKFKESLAAALAETELLEAETGPLRGLADLGNGKNDFKTTLEAYYEWVDVVGVPYTPGGVLDAEAASLYWGERDRASGVQENVKSRGAKGHSIITWVSQNFPTEELMLKYGYSFDGREWASPYQQASGKRHSTKIYDDGSWVSLSYSDAEAGLGKSTARGRYGDAFDLIVHYGFHGDQENAFRWALGARSKAFSADPYIHHLKTVVNKLLVKAGHNNE